MAIPWRWPTGVTWARAATGFELWDLAGQQRLWQHTQYAVPGEPLLFPTAARVTPDGQRAGFACWGSANQAEVLWVDRNQPSAAQLFDLPGSALGLAINDAGTRLAVSAKSIHAQTLGGTGSVMMLQPKLGELELTAPLGGAQSLVQVSAARADASIALLLVGQPHAPAQVGGVGGSLLLDRSRLSVWAPTNRSLRPGHLAFARRGRGNRGRTPLCLASCISHSDRDPARGGVAEALGLELGLGSLAWCPAVLSAGLGFRLSFT